MQCYEIAVPALVLHEVRRDIKFLLLDNNKKSRGILKNMLFSLGYQAVSHFQQGKVLDEVNQYVIEDLLQSEEINPRIKENGLEVLREPKNRTRMTTHHFSITSIKNLKK